MNDESDSVPLLSHASRLFQEFKVSNTFFFIYDTLHRPSSRMFYMRNDAFPNRQKAFPRKASQYLLEAFLRIRMEVGVGCKELYILYVRVGP